MLLTISILAGISYIVSFIGNLCDDNCDVNLLTAAILIIALWTICLPLAIIVLMITVIIGIFKFLF